MAKDNSDFFKVKNNWSLIKDKLLGCYLTPYLQKVLGTKKKICYVDCFSGKGKFEDNQPGSPMIALQIRDDCLNRSRMNIDKQNAIDMTFIDLNFEDELRQNLAPFDNYYGKPNIIGGKYEEQIMDVLRQRRGQNVFLYIDPYGIKALDINLFDQFNSMGFNSFEMLINFNSFGFFRDACRVMSVAYDRDNAFKGLEDLVEYEPTTVSANDNQSEQLLNAIAGGDYWKAIVLDYKAGIIDGYQAEQRLSTEYKQRLKTRYKYVLDMPIRLKADQRPKYRMIHVSEHRDACFLMAQNMQNRKDELYTNIQTGGQMSIFDITPGYSQSTEGEWYTREQIVEKVKDAIRNAPGNIGITEFLAGFANDFGLICDFKMIEDILGELQKAGDIDIIRDPATTPTGRPAAYWEEKDGRTVTIRRQRI